MHPEPMRPDLEDAPTRDELEEQLTHTVAGITAMLEGLTFFLARVDRTTSRAIAAQVHAHVCSALRAFIAEVTRPSR